jgi:hypothetical protein
MGNTYGGYETLIVCGRYEGSLEAIAEVLNGFIFDQDEGPRAIAQQRKRRWRAFVTSQANLLPIKHLHCAPRLTERWEHIL